MAVDLEALRRQLLDFIRTLVDVECQIAGTAEEVVVVRTLGQLVPKPAAGKLHLRQPSVIRERLHVPIDGGQPEGRHDPLAVL